MYALSGQKWGAATNGTSSGPVYWSSDYIDALDFDRAQWGKSDFDQSLQRAFQSWEDVAGIDFEQADADNSAVITIGTEVLAGRTIGLATYTYQPRDGVDQFTSARIVFDEDEAWSPHGGGSTQDFEAIALHEIGHAIGLDHVDDESEILSPIVSVDELGDGDIAGAQVIYGLPTVSNDDVLNAAVTEDENEAVDGGGGGDGVAGILALLGLGVIVLVGGAGGLIAGGAMAAVGALAGGGGGGGAAGGGASKVAAGENPTDFMESFPIIEFSTAGLGCPTCGDDACFGCGELDEDDAADALA